MRSQPIVDDGDKMFMRNFHVYDVTGSVGDAQSRNSPVDRLAGFGRGAGVRPRKDHPVVTELSVVVPRSNPSQLRVPVATVGATRGTSEPCLGSAGIGGLVDRVDTSGPATS